jgi:carbon storage regulator
MLILSRKRGERIVVPHCNLAVTIIGTKGNAVRLGICAPESLAVYREEVWQRICHEAKEPPTEQWERAWDL